jgi:cytochrome c oxidase subunit 3
VPPSAASETAARPLTPLRVGTVVWLASELMFFSGLFAAYFTLRSVNDAWPPSDVELDALRTAAFTIALIASSATYHVAARAAERGDMGTARRWTLATSVLGLVFLANQATEYAQAEFGITSHAYGSMFFLMTGFHGLHVLGGIVLMLAVLAVAAPGGRARADELVVVSEYYWHFVDAVWVGMFATIYLVR